MYVCMYIHHHRGIIPPPIPWGGGGGGGGNTGHGTNNIILLGGGVLPPHIFPWFSRGAFPICAIQNTLVDGLIGGSTYRFTGD